MKAPVRITAKEVLKYLYKLAHLSAYEMGRASRNGICGENLRSLMMSDVKGKVFLVLDVADGKVLICQSVFVSRNFFAA